MSYYADILASSVKIVKPEELYRDLGGSKEKPELADIMDAVNDGSVGEWDIFRWNGGLEITISFGDKYRKEDWEFFAPYIEGSIDFRGEDDSLWRNAYKNGQMYTESLRVVSDSEMLAACRLAAHVGARCHAGDITAPDMERLLERIPALATEYSINSSTQNAGEFLDGKIRKNSHIASQTASAERTACL